MCQRQVKYDNDPRARVLGERYDAMLQRCIAVDNELYKNYGARGIRLKFDNREHFIRWMLAHLPHEDYRGVQIDRANNDGHYEPGNLLLVSQQENLRNKRNNVWVDYFGAAVVVMDLHAAIKKDFPQFTLAPATVRNYISPKRLNIGLLETLRRGGVTEELIQQRHSRMSTT